MPDCAEASGEPGPPEAVVYLLGEVERGMRISPVGLIVDFIAGGDAVMPTGPGRRGAGGEIPSTF
ncbi:hypothetical protein GCM10010277_03050 [Streptomyces longisporoflavus]|nr:hypothetical protein GCM10010277_03050 [Streptomyces longisporoflavus]